MPADIAEAVRDALARRGLSVKPNQIAHLTDRSRLLGARLWHRFKPEIRNELAATPAIRIMGVGYALTEFAISPVALSREAATCVSALGGLANLIVATFDEKIDDGIPSGNVLAPSALEDVNPCRNVIERLVKKYYEEMAVVTRGAPEVRMLLQRAIRRMYDAEILTAQGGAGIAGHIWRRKSALPFVVMGFAAWGLASAQVQSRRMAHLRWLYRLGELIGLVDDSVDLQSDQTAGRANRVAVLVSERGLERPAERIAALATRVLSEWDGFVYRSRTKLLVRQTLPAVIWSCLTPFANSP